MLFLFAVGVLLWLLYGFWIHSLPIIVANLITSCLILFLLWMKVRSH